MAMSYNEKMDNFNKAKVYKRYSNDEYEKWKHIKNNVTTKEEYSVYLKDYRWINRKNYIKGLRGAICMSCGKTHSLHIHHLRYYGKFPWEVNDEDLICLCNECHSKAHSGELNNLSELISNFDNKEVDNKRVLCFKNNNFLGNFELIEIEALFNVKTKGIINCCEDKTKSSGGYYWKYPKINQRIELYSICESPSTTKEYINLTLGKYSNTDLLHEKKNNNIINDWELNFINTLFNYNTLSMKQKIMLVKITNKLESS